MTRNAVVLAAALVGAFLMTGSAQARPAGGGHGGGGPRPPSGGWSGGATLPEAEAQEPIDWLTDYDLACRRAAETKSPLMTLVTSEEAERAGQSCTFRTNVIRRAVREARVVPVKLLPPARPEVERLSAEEAKLQQETYKKSKERFEALLKTLGVTKVPTLIYAAPDAARLAVQIAPSDQEIIATLARLPELVKAHMDAVAQDKDKDKDGDKKPEKAVVAKGEPGKQPEAKPPEVKDGEPATKPAEGAGGADDF